MSKPIKLSYSFDEIKEMLEVISTNSGLLLKNDNDIKLIDRTNAFYINTAQNNLNKVILDISKKKIGEKKIGEKKIGKESYREANLRKRRKDELNRLNRRDRSVAAATLIRDASPESKLIIAKKFVDEEEHYYTTTDKDGEKIELPNAKAMFNDLRTMLSETHDPTDDIPEEILKERAREATEKILELAQIQIDEATEMLNQQEDETIKIQRSLGISPKYKKSVPPKSRKGIGRTSPGLADVDASKIGLASSTASSSRRRGGGKDKSKSKKRRNSKSKKRSRSRSNSKSKLKKRSRSRSKSKSKSKKNKKNNLL